MPMQDNALIVSTDYFPISTPGSELKLTCAKDGTDFQPREGDGQEGSLRGSGEAGKGQLCPAPSSCKRYNTSFFNGGHAKHFLFYANLNFAV